MELERLKQDLASRTAGGVVTPHPAVRDDLAMQLKCKDMQHEIATLQAELKHSASEISHRDSANADLRAQIALLTRIAENVPMNPAQRQSAKGATHASSTRSRASSQPSNVERYSLADGEDEDDDDDESKSHESWIEEEEEDPPAPGAGVTNLAATKTATTTKVKAGGSGGGDGGHGNGDNGGDKPPKLPREDKDKDKDKESRRPRRNAKGGGGGGGDDPNPGDGSNADDDEADEQDDEQRRTRRSSRRSAAASASEPDYVRKKEGEEIKTPVLPRTAADVRAWMNSTGDSFSACARDPNRAFARFARIKNPECTFEELANIPREYVGLDTKLRSSVSKHCLGSEADKNRALVQHLDKRREELELHGDTPRQITGMQLVWLIHRFFKIHESSQVSYDLCVLTDLTYPGDAKLPEWKDQLDGIIRHLKTKLSDSEKLGIVRKKLAGSERLRDHLSYLERIPESHGDHTYEWLSGLIDKVIDDDRQRRNQDSLVAAASGKEKPTKVTPARRKKQEQDEDPPARTVAPGQPGGPTKPKPKPKPKGGGRGGSKGGGRGDGSHTDTDSEAPTWTGVPRKSVTEYPGTALKDVAADKRCCLQYCWVNKGGFSCCWNFNKGVQCPLGKHVAPQDLTKEMKATNLYAKLLAERGKMNCPKDGPKAPPSPGKS